MIHYHGTPVGGYSEEAVRFLRGRHAFMSYAHHCDIGAAAAVCESFALDNGAFSLWRSGKAVDWEAYVDWVGLWSKHPAYDWAIVPDVIGGTGDDNMTLVAKYISRIPGGVPVWHLHESLDYLRYLSSFPRIALGSSGAYSTPGTTTWWGRIGEAMDVICDDGVPRCKIHGLRMLNHALFSIPFSSADSTNAVRNSSNIKRFGMYPPPTRGQRCEVIASIVESHQSAPVWVGRRQEIFDLG